MRAVWVAAMLVPAVLAGCLGSGEENDAGLDDGLADVMVPDLAALMAGVPCEASAVGAETSENVKLLGNMTPLNEEISFAELDIRGNWAVGSTYFSNNGFEIFDITNPLEAVWLGNFSGARGGSFDVKVTPDLSTVFIGTGPGVDIVDVRDPANATITGGWDFPPQSTTASLAPSAAGTHAHMIYYYEFDEHRLLFVAPQDGTSMYVLKVGGEPGAITLETITQLQPDFVGGGLGPHDMWATYDEVLSAHVVYIANGLMGWLAYDVTDPAAPEMLGGMINPDTHQGYLHTVQAQWIGDRRIVATVSEVGVNAMRVFDATNLRAPVLLGSWTFDNTPPRTIALQHNLQIVNGTLYFAHYGQGVFVFDLTKVGDLPYGEMQRLRPVAHVAVERNSWDVLLKDGLLYVTAGNEILVAGYGCNAPGDALLTSTG